MFQKTLTLFLLLCIWQFSQACNGDCTANFEYTFNTPTSVTFTDLSTCSGGQPIGGWEWDFDDGNGSTEQSPTHEYSSEQLSVVCLTLKDDEGNPIDRHCEVVFNSNSTTCKSNYLSFQLSSTLLVSFSEAAAVDSEINEVNFFHWTFGDNESSFEQCPTHEYEEPGTYQVCLEIGSESGCFNQFCQDVEVTQSCNAGFEYTSSDLSVAFSDQSVSDSTIISWNWDFGDGNTGTGQNPQHDYSLIGDYMVCLTITSSDMCTDTYCENISVTTFPTCETSFSFNNGNGLTVDFQDQTQANALVTLWDWTMGDGNFSSIENPTHTYSAPGTYFVCLVTGTAAGCIDEFCQEITVGDAAMCMADFNFDIIGHTVDFFDASISASQVVEWSWDFDDGATSDLPNPSHSYEPTPFDSLGGITYEVCLTIEDLSGCIDVICQDVNVISPPLDCLSDFDYSINGLTVTFSESSMGIALPPTFDWDFGDNTSSFSQEPSPKTYAEAGTYQVCLTVDCFEGGEDKHCENITLLPTNLQEHIIFEAIEIFPNPVQSVLNIQLEIEELKDVRIEVIDLLGKTQQQLFVEHMYGQWNGQLDMSTLSNGIYFLRLTTEDQQSYSHKIIKAD